MRRLLVVASLATVLAGCGVRTPQGMNVTTPRVSADDDALMELARATPTEGERVLLVVYPRDACTGSTSAVIVDERGRFLGAVAPETAALVRVPREGRLLAFSSIDVTASDRSEPLVQEIDPRAVTDGFVFRTLRGRTMRHCTTGQYMEALFASKSELEAVIAEKEYVFLEPDSAAGQAWLDAHRARVDRIIGLAPAPRHLANTRARVVYR